jgi:CheY-like chemotaxis protein
MLRDCHVVVAFSRQPSVADFVKTILEEAGYEAIACWSTVDDLERAVSDSNPCAIVYEVGFPLDAELEQLREVRVRRGLAGIPLVIATPAPAALYQHCGIARALEIFTRPSKRDVDAALQNACAFTVSQGSTPAAPSNLHVVTD